MSAPVEVFERKGGPFCQNCFAVKRTLAKEGVAYVVKELTLDITAEFKDRGFMEQPIVAYMGRVHSGFRPAELERIAHDWRYFEERSS